MAKVYDVTTIELREGIKGEEFEAFWLNEYGPLGQQLGWISHLMKADRGIRAGKYAVIWEMPDIELRNRIVTADGQLTEEGTRLLEPDFQMLNKKLDTFVTGWPHTGYVELGKS